MIRHPQPKQTTGGRLKQPARGRVAQRILCGVLTLLSLSVVLAFGNTQPTNAPPAAEASLPKSVFVYDLPQGKDPFFPKSTRRGPPKVVQPDVQPEVVDGACTLQGLSIVGGRKLALINKRTLAEGEEMDVRTKSGIVRVKCIEIRERSVVISIRGVTQEIFLRPGL